MSNDACIGYIISALRRQGWGDEEIREVTLAEYFEFGFKTPSEAEEIYARRND